MKARNQILDKIEGSKSLFEMIKRLKLIEEPYTAKKIALGFSALEKLMKKHKIKYPIN